VGWFEPRVSLIFAACILYGMAFFLCHSQAQAQGILLEIELDAFSGRPNPRWELTGEQAAEFLTRLRALRPTLRSHFEEGGLGYRGFIVRAKGEPLGGFDEVRLYRGTVLARYGGRTDTFSDAERILERWLLNSARGHVDGSVLQYVQGEIGR
jgi:hypothetical protein